MDNAIIFQVLGVLLVLFFGFITYMNTKTWKWVHVTFLILVFLAIPAFGVYAAMSLKTRKAWMTLAQKQSTDLEAVQTRVELLKNGEANDVKREKDSVIGKNQELTRMILDRGRVWRNLQPSGAGAGTITLTIPGAAAPAAPAPIVAPMPVDPNAPMDPNAQPMDPNAQPMPQPAPVAQAAAGVAHNLVEKLVVYAFKDASIVDEATGAAIVAPGFFLGEFMVTKTDATSVTLAPMMKLAPDQEQRINGNAANEPGSWTLYEVSPIDTYEIFAGLDANAIKKFIPQAETGLPNDAYEALINTFVLDGQRAPDNTAPENLWAEVKFLKTHKEEVDAPPLPANNLPGVEPFDKDGKAQASRLHRQEGDISEFSPGDLAIMPNERAEELVAQGIVEKIQPIYRRRIIDFATRLTSINYRKLEIDSNVRQVNRDIETLKAANVEADKQIALETDLKSKLEADLAKVKHERDGIAGYGSSLYGQLTATNDQIRQLYASNKALNEELRVLTAKATEDADRRTREATAAVR
jgi:hypothetical protein